MTTLTPHQQDPSRKSRTWRARIGQDPSRKGRTGGPRLALALFFVRQFRVPLALIGLFVLVTCLRLAYHYGGWADAVALREHVGAHAYHFGRYADDAHNKTDKLLADGAPLAFRPALFAAALTAVVTAREWESRRTSLTLAQSVTPHRWFAVRWATLGTLLAVLVLPMVVLYRISASHAFGLDLLVHGASRQTALLTIGPVTVAYVLLGVAAGAYTGTLLRRTLPALVAAPALTWLVAAVLVRSRAALLLDFPAFSKVEGYHPGGVLGLQFSDVLPQDSYLLNSLSPGDYWGYQLASAVLALAVAALLTHAAFRVLRRRTA
ncbi:hypothetical protein [Streptomyces sp. NPDC002530]